MNSPYYRPELALPEPVEGASPNVVTPMADGPGKKSTTETASSSPRKRSDNPATAATTLSTPKQPVRAAPPASSASKQAERLPPMPSSASKIASERLQKLTEAIAATGRRAHDHRKLGHRSPPRTRMRANRSSPPGDPDIEYIGTSMPGGEPSSRSKRRAADDSSAVAPPTKKAKAEPVPAAPNEEMADEEADDEDLVDEQMGIERDDDDESNGEVAVGEQLEEGEVDRNRVDGQGDKLAGTLVTTVDEFDSVPVPSNYRANRTASDGRRFPSALEHEIAALRSHFNALSGDIGVKLAIIRQLEQREERRTGQPFGEYQSPDVPEAHNHWDVRSVG